jgi:cell division protein FtsI (penicillin-binding protein 3)/stage V sporulation protein D (sporulation-specific penicillin-binding protein)
VLSFDGAAVELLSVGDDSATLMPRVQGLSLRQALEVLAPLDIRLEVTGRGIVVSQAPPPGAPLPAGSLCRLALASPAARP